MVRRNACSTFVRRFAGPQANEIAIVCRPEDRSLDTVQQGGAIYGELAAILAAHQASFRDVACETLYLRDIRRDLPLLLDVRKRILAEIGQGAGSPPPAFIQQAPLAECARFELSASVVVPHRRDAWSVRDVRAEPSCACEGCARSTARLVRLGEQTSLQTTNVYGAGNDAFEQAWNMFQAAERLLGESGMGFHDVVRTWIHLRDIVRDYDVLNKARREFFRHCGIQRMPASTGIQGIPFPDVHDFSMHLYAVKSRHLGIDVTPLSTPYLSEAWTYGADFSRGLRVAEANKVSLYVSGTASIDEAGQTVHVGDFEAQVDRMLDNIASLLAPQGASFENLVSGVAYLRSSNDAPVLRSLFRERGFDGFPCALLEAPLCRPDLLCEAEAVAVLPLATSGA